MRIGVLTVSDRAFRGEYEDKGGPAIEEYLTEAFGNRASANQGTAVTLEFVRKIVPDELEEIAKAIVEMSGSEGKCVLICTTGGTGPAPR
jgi:molybdopterin adenylyltransferase